MFCIKSFHADDSSNDHSWSEISWPRKGSGKWVVHTLVANNSYLLVSCCVEAIICG